MTGHLTLLLVSFNLMLDPSLAPNAKRFTILQIVPASEVSGMFSRCGSLLSCDWTSAGV